MPLAEYTPETREIPFGKEKEGKRNSLTVRALSLNDITPMISSRMGDLEQLYSIFKGAKAAIYATHNVSSLLVMVVTKLPDLASEVISVACDEPGNKAQAARLPIAVQVAALSEIMKLTLEDAGGLKNLYGMLTNLTDELLPQSVRAGLASQMTKSLAPSEKQ